MTDKKEKWQKFITKLILKMKSLVSEEAKPLEEGITHMQQQIASLQDRLENVTANIPNQIEEVVQKQLTELLQSEMLLSTSVDLSDVQLQLNKTTFAPSEEIIVSFVASSTFASNAWIGVIPSSVAHGSETLNDQHDLSFQYINGRKSGNMVFNAPIKEGSYDLRMHDTDFNGNEVYAVSFEVLLT